MKSTFAAALLSALLVPSLAAAEVLITDSSRTMTIDCNQDPEIAANGSSLELTITGPCTKIAINGSSITASIESILRLAVNGSSNEIAVDAADKIAVVGSANTITYKRAVTPKKRTKVGNLGSNNKIKRVK